MKYSSLSGVKRFKLPQSLDRVAPAAPLKLHRRHLEAGVAAERKAAHLGPLLPVGELCRNFMRRDAGRYHQQLIELQLVGRRLCEADMAVVAGG